MNQTSILHKLHRVSACVIGAYVAVHLFNHGLVLRGVEAHIQFMESFRHIYRTPFVEGLLFVCIIFQIGSGVYFIKKRWRQRHGFFERVQVISGGYLVFFFLVHIGAVLFGRAVLGLDTNLYYAVAGMHVPYFQYFFVPYYFFAVAAFFGHIASAFYWLMRNRLSEVARNYFGYTILVAGIVFSTLIVATFAGVFYDIKIPQEYIETYQP
ncbi:MAG: hypothetical protein UY07_C0028G0010 [Parcubacteria group bacterium GW2011_GWA1_47_8]|nr:MAG: hypothetical protein UY07_C0028G0010 [Parcubacteria group bacterium GW2011_GWA1_47_8]